MQFSVFNAEHSTAKLYYTSWLGSNWEKMTIFWDQSQINWDQFGSIPKPCHPKPRPTTPTDFSEISTVLHQKEKFGFLKIIYSYLSINKRNSFSESESKMSLTWNIFASPLLILLIRAFRNTEKWTLQKLDLCLNHVTALISEQFIEKLLDE